MHVTLVTMSKLNNQSILTMNWKPSKPGSKYEQVNEMIEAIKIYNMCLDNHHNMVMCMLGHKLLNLIIIIYNLINCHST